MNKMKLFVRKHNKGFSLIEVLVALAITGIVATLVMTVITLSTKFFRKQTTTLDVQNQLQEASNKINDMLIEATSITMYNSGNAIVYYNGTDSYDEDGNYVTEDKITPKYLVWFRTGDHEGCLYLMDRSYFLSAASVDTIASEDYEGYLLTDLCTSLSISIDSSCYALTESGSTDYTTVTQPLILNMSLKLTDGEESKYDSKTVTLRNTLNSISLSGTVNLK